MYNKADLHLHTTASDGSDTPSELVAKAREKGLDIIAVSDHDTLVGSLEALRIPHDGIKIVTGIEFSCHHYGELSFDCHILGYGFDPEAQSMHAAIAHGREMRLFKLEARLKYLYDRFGISFDDADIAYLHSLNSVARPHLGRLLVERGHAKDMIEAMDYFLKGSRFPDDRIDAREAIEAIRAAGGVPVYAHPIGGERETHLDREAVLSRIVALKELGLMGIECYYSRYSEAEEDMLVEIAQSLGLLVSGGSDYHGENKTVKLGTLSENAREVGADKITVLSAVCGK